MFKLFRLIFLRNIRSVLILFVVLFFSSTGFLVMRELTDNIENLVARETQPLFGADMIVSPRSYVTTPIIDTLAPYLSGVAYSWGERTEFSTTLFDREGKTGLVKIIAYTGIYPQKGILTTKKIPGQEKVSTRVSVTPNLLSHFSSGNIIRVDGRPIELTDTIVESSDMGFSFGGDNSLIILPASLLSGSMLISFGSRLDQDLLLSFSDAKSVQSFNANIRDNKDLSEYRIRTYNERSERTFDTTKELTNYILLILVVAALFAGIILRSAHDNLFSSLAHTLGTMEVLGLSRLRQASIFVLLYILILPVSFVLSIVCSYGIISLIATFPAASEFVFLASPINFTIEILAILVLTSFFPAWMSKFSPRNILTRFVLWAQKNLSPRTFKTLKKISWGEGISLFFAGVLILYIIFEDILWTLIVVSGGIVSFLILAILFRIIYQVIFRLSERLRWKYFSKFDGLRTLVRPLTPTIPITLSLISITSFLVLFLLFTFSFREKLVTDTSTSANIYAINILEEDREKIEKILQKGELYSILRARISGINGLSLVDFLAQDDPSPEFTREFNITTTPLDIPILKGKEIITKDEVSVDDEFGRRLGVGIGDTIDFMLSGKKITLRVANIRKSVRDGFQPFFYFSFQEEAFKNAPKTYFASTYTEDIESWKKNILENSGPHVTFIDVDNILSIAREIAGKILAVISLFFFAVSAFGVGALISLFARLRDIEDIKRKLYPLFGSSVRVTLDSFRTTRYAILSLSFIFSIVIGLALFFIVTRSSSVLALSALSFVLTIGSSSILFFLLYIVIAPRASGK